jgi:rod shape-determining protein MreC
MDWRSSWLKEKKTLIHTVIAVALAASLLFTGNSFRGKVGSVTTMVFYTPFNQIKQVFNLLDQAARQNQNASIDATEYSIQKKLFEEIKAENERLRAMLGFAERPDYDVVPAEILSVVGAGIPNRVIINLGASDSVRENQTVINRNGVAGRIAQVLDNHSVVYLLTEPRCRVAARIKRNREEGIIRYSISRGMYLDNCPQQGDVAVGDTLITSGLGGIFPEGLTIGTVRSVEAPEKEFFYDISIDPAINFNALDELYILKEKK